MTKIEQWQEWAKQYNDLREKQKDLQEKLDNLIIDFCASSGPCDIKCGHVQYYGDMDKIIIYANTQRIDLPVYAGRELLSVLKQLYEEPCEGNIEKPKEKLTYMGETLQCPKCGSTNFETDFNYDFVTCKNCGEIPIKDLIPHKP